MNCLEPTKLNAVQPLIGCDPKNRVRVAYKKGKRRAGSERRKKMYSAWPGSTGYVKGEITGEEPAGAGLADITEFLDEISQSGGYREARSKTRYSPGP